MDSSDDCTIKLMYLMTHKYILKNAQNGKFYLSSWATINMYLKAIPAQQNLSLQIKAVEFYQRLTGEAFIPISESQCKERDTVLPNTCSG